MGTTLGGSAVLAEAEAVTGVTYGVRAETRSSSGYALYGHATGTTGATYGVFGRSDAPSGTGLHGTATNTSGSTYGVKAFTYSREGTSVYAISYGGTAVYGQAVSTTRPSVHARNTSGVALRAEGKVQFSTAGVAVVPEGADRVTVDLARVGPADFAVATVQGNEEVSVQGAKTARGKVTIWLDRTANSPTTVAYFVISPSS